MGSAGSVELGIDGPGRVPGELAGLTPQDVAPQGRGVAAERVERLGRDDVPAALVHLDLELSGRPAGVPGEDAQPGQAAGQELRGRVEVEESEGSAYGAEAD